MVTHETLLRGLDSGSRPLILERTDDDFIGGTLDDLMRGLDVVEQSRAADTTAGRPAFLKLYQPVQRTFHLALFDAVCDHGFAMVRLDPARILEAGLVIRRVEGRRVYAWGEYAPRARGWIERSAQQLEADPALGGALPVPRTGRRELDRRLAVLSAPSMTFKESTSPLFVAPPDVLESTGRTVLYGMIPLASSERSARPASPGSAADRADHLPAYLHAAPRTREIGRANRTVTLSTVEAAALDLSNRDNRLFLDYVAMLKQLTYEFAAFDDSGDFPEGQALFRVLDTLRLPFYRADTIDQREDRPAGQELRRAAEVLVLRRQSGPVLMPLEWPPISDAQAQAISTAVDRIVQARIAGVRPQEGRFENPAWTYTVRAFARVRTVDGCSSEVVWSRPSEVFAIAPWYEGKGPATPIVLPGIAEIKKIKPNVAFKVPRDLFNLLEGSDPKGLMEGKSRTASLTFDWICSFNIPVITLCAFIVLNIFLQLFDLIFQWMLYIKICIPLPKQE